MRRLFFVCLLAVYCISSTLCEPNLFQATDATFAKVTKGKPALVVVTAPWCSKCHELRPMWEELAPHLKDLRFVEVEGPDNDAIRHRFHVSSYPTMAFVPDGESPVDVPFTGKQTLDAIRKFVTRASGPVVVPLSELKEEMTMAQFVICPEASSEARAMFEQLAAQHHDWLAFYQAESQDACTSRDAEADSILAVEGPTGPASSVFDAPLTQESLGLWMLRCRHPAFSPLNEYPEALLAQAEHVVLSVLDERERAIFRLQQRVMTRLSHEFPKMAFLWANGLADERLIRHYEVDPDLLPRLVVVHSRTNRYYRLPADSDISDPIDLRAFLEAVQRGEVEGKPIAVPVVQRTAHQSDDRKAEGDSPAMAPRVFQGNSILIGVPVAAMCLVALTCCAMQGCRRRGSPRASPKTPQGKDE